MESPPVPGSPAPPAAALPAPIGFRHGTLIATPAGNVPVQELRPGLPVLTASGQVAAVRWLGRRIVENPTPAELPVCIRANAFGPGLPQRNLLVPAAQALALRGAMAEAGALANGFSVLAGTPAPALFSYWHVEIEGHGLVLAEGVPAESFVDYAMGPSFENWARHPGGPPPSPPPRARSADEVPLVLRAWLLAFASAAAA